MEAPSTPPIITKYDTEGYIRSLKAKLPEDSKEAVEILLAEVEQAEQRRRDTQAEYTNNRQNLVKLRNERDFLKSKVSPQVKTDEALDTLKYEDPEAYRQEMNRREEEAKQALEQELQSTSAKSQAEFELEERKRILRSFAEANPDFDITSPEVQDQIPPRYLKQLETGEISFEIFLNSTKKFIEAPKTTSKDIPPVDTKDNKLPGSSEPKQTFKPDDVLDNYNKLIF